MRPRIGIDMHVVDGKYQGSRTHVIELFSRVIAVCPEIDFFLFLADPDKLTASRPEFSLPNAHAVHMPQANPLVRLGWQLPLLQKRYALDLLHTQYILPFPNLSAAAVTIHDVLFESHPEYFGAFFRWRSRILMRLSASQADHVFTVSVFSKAEIVRRYGVAEDRITVTPNAADPARFFPGDAGQELVTARGFTPRNYILSVGRLEPRKNHATLVRAYAKLGGDAPPLVIVGQRDFGYGGLFAEISRLNLAGRVHLIEDADDRELPALYRNARLFVYPAYAEGFGMPPLEALASGVPVVSSNTTSIPEVVGDAGLLVNPDDEMALAAAMGKILSDPALAIRLVNAGLEQAVQFSWIESARRVRQQYLALAR